MNLSKTIITEPLYPPITPHSWEIELFNSSAVRRLKQLAHFGAGALVSSVVHSRYEHTVGVWKLAAHFFQEDSRLRAAAILHDIGHLPFSHAVEKTLGFNHHTLTEQYILEEEVSSILEKNRLHPDEIIAYLNQATPLTGQDDILGLDHLDSFLRDTYMTGNIEMLPKTLLSRLSCTPKGIETDNETGLYLLQLIAKDHELFLSPFMLAVDRLLAEAIKLHWEKVDNKDMEGFARLTDSDIINMLKNSRSYKARYIIQTLLIDPSKMMIKEGQTGHGIPITIRKVYRKTPLWKGEPLINRNKEGQKLLQRLEILKGEYEVFLAFKKV